MKSSAPKPIFKICYGKLNTSNVTPKPWIDNFECIVKKLFV